MRRDEFVVRIVELLPAEILELRHLGFAKRRGRAASVGVEDALDLRRPAGAFEIDVDDPLEEEAEFQVKLVEIFRHGQAARLHPGTDLGKHQAGGVAILVPQQVVGQITIALLAAEQVERAVFLQERRALPERSGVIVKARPHRLNEFLLVAAHFAGDPLEAGQRVDDLHPVPAADRVLQRGGDKGLDDGRGLRAGRRNPPEFLVFRDAIVGQQRANLVPCEQFHFARLVPDRRAHAVAVGIGRHHEVVAALLRHGEGHRQRLGVLRIRGLHRGEAGIKGQLFGDLGNFRPGVVQQRDR